jgi:hypothetical protein
MKMKFKLFKGKNKVFMLAAAFLLIVIVGAAAFMTVGNMIVSGDPVWNSGSDKTELTPVSDGSSSSGGSSDASGFDVTPSPTAAGGAPTPSPTWNPTDVTLPVEESPSPAPSATVTVAPSVTAAPTDAPKARVLVWQTLFVRNADGSSYWVNPRQPFVAANIFGGREGDSLKLVSSTANAFYMNVPADGLGGRSVVAWSSHFKVTMVVKDQNHNLRGYLYSGRVLDSSGGAVASGANIQIASGGDINAASLESMLINYAKVTKGVPVYYVENYMSDVTIRLKLSDGSIVALAAPGPSGDNVLSWTIRVL